ncbi:spermidine synthase [Nigerium massiliense]|uniref:spermidine synthase n=1 Tax=Nigerium massiliense TaxID=1522317 RepID=UPI00058CBEC2|nr:hypothetical protein [Nigerium massiliense]
MEPVETIARADTPLGELALRRRGDVVELIVNGVFAMDSAETTSELALADAAGTPPGRVLVGGLGLGYTAARLLDNGAAEIDVVELAGALLDWAGAGVTPQLARVAGDPRVRLHAADIGDWIAGRAETWDAILLDVDNGPTFLVHDGNERLYAAPLLTEFARRLGPGGVLMIWCETPSPALLATLQGLGPGLAADEVIVPIEREGRAFDYALYRLRRGPGD